MVQRVRHTIQEKGSSSIKCTSQSQQSDLQNLQKIKDTLDEGYDSDGEPGHFCDMEDLEDNQYFVDSALPDVFPLDTGDFFLTMKIINMMRKEGTSKIRIHHLQCMLTSQNVKSKR